MGIYFNNEALKRLSGEQFATLNNLADAAQAENISEQDDAEKEAMKNYIADLQKKEADAAAAQKDLVSTFI